MLNPNKGQNRKFKFHLLGSDNNQCLCCFRNTSFFGNFQSHCSPNGQYIILSFACCHNIHDVAKSMKSYQSATNLRKSKESCTM